MIRIALLVLISFAGSVASQPTVPDTPAGRVLAAWLQAFNAGDEASMGAFDARHAPRGPPMSMAAEIRKDSGGFTLVRLERSEPLALVAHLKAKNSDDVRRFELDVVADAVPRIRRALLQRLPQPMPEPEALAAMSEAVDAAVREGTFSGVVLVARGDKILLEKVGGLADRSEKLPITRDTRLRIGSMNKMFTAVATLQLIEAGKLALGDTIAKHLPDYPNAELARKVTVRHLLTHTGGTGDIFGPDFAAHRLALREHGDYVDLYGERGLEFEPGSRQEYSNYGFVLLGALIEKASGLSYHDYVDRHVFVPAGMHSTGALPETTSLPQRALGYTTDNGDLVPNTDTLPWRGTAAGGGYTTVDDLLRFARALTSGNLVSSGLVAEATRPQEKGYGYGFGTGNDGIARYFGHAGGAPGMNGELRVFPTLGYVVVALSNLDPPAADKFVTFFSLRIPQS